MDCLAFVVEAKEEAKVNHIQTLHSCGRHTDARSSLFAAFGSDLSGNPQTVISSLYKAVKEPNEVLKCIAEVFIECSEFKTAMPYALAVYHSNDEEILDKDVIRLAICYRGLSLYSEAMKLLDTIKGPSARVHQLLGEINLDLKNMITAEDHLVAALDSYYKEELIVQRYDYYGTVTGEAIEVNHLNLASKSP